LTGAAEGSVEREVARLAAERTALFGRSGGSAGLSNAEQSRLRAIERALDECFVSLRRMRAARAASRLARDDPFARGVARAAHPARGARKPEGT
jgi:Protein of unknown function (DUF2630)